MKIECDTRHVTRPVSTTSPERQDRLSQAETLPFETIRALEEKLRTLSDVRPEKVAEGRELVADVAYPPDEVLESIANLLAMKLQ